MKMIESIRLLYNARKYRLRVGQSCINYITDNIRPGQTVINVGAGNGGSLYYILRQTGADGRLIAFEPETERYRNIIRYKKSLDWHNVIPEHLAPSDEDGVALLYIPDGNKPADYLTRGGGNDLRLQKGNYAIEGVYAETLDAYCYRNNIKPDFIKIEACGNEADVLEGAVGVLKKYRPRILLFADTQVLDAKRFQEITELMSWLRYTGYFLKETQKIPLDHFSHGNLRSGADGAPLYNLVFE